MVYRVKVLKITQPPYIFSEYAKRIRLEMSYKIKF